MFMMIVGWVGLSQFPGLDSNSSEQITIIVLQDISARIPIMQFVTVLFLSAAIAAIMSTVDSALLAISSMLTKDIYGRFAYYSDQSTLTRLGKIFSWIIMAFAVVLAIHLPQTIWRIMEIKLELLCQIFPAILIGLHFKHIDGRSILAGLTVGIMISVVLILNSDLPSKPWGIHAGIWGLAFNVVSVWLFQYFYKK